ncbi:MAG: RNA methyltransferase [bacterium]
MIHSKPIVIFVRPRAKGNIGALARIMSNFGLDELRFVKNPLGADAFTREQSPVDWAMACRGEKVLQKALTYSSLSDAMEGIHWALGTTARIREKDSGYSRPFYEYPTLLKEKKLDGKRWALVLGTEDDGLSEEELSLCHALTTIDTDPQSPSMNVAMAAGCLLYAWSEAAHEFKKINPAFPQKITIEDLTSLKEIEKLAQYILETLKLSEFFKYPDAEAVLARIRRIFQKEHELTRGDVLFVFEIFYQLRAKITGRHDDRNFLS